MPNINWNRSHWSDRNNWESDGEHWSAHWGSSSNQWYLTILPRIAECLPSGRIIEIAPGFGRWTRFLVPQCQSYRGYDLSEECVAECKRRLPLGGLSQEIDFVVNDGRSLPLEAAASVDFVFSFDSLVHAEQDIINAYLEEISRILKPGGRAFIHHSNLAACRYPPSHYTHERGIDVSAESVAHATHAAGLLLLVQEIVTWNSLCFLDCFSSLAKPPIDGFKAAQRAENSQFWEDIARQREILKLYSR